MITKNIGIVIITYLLKHEMSQLIKRKGGAGYKKRKLVNVAQKAYFKYNKKNQQKICWFFKSGICKTKIVQAC
ncbi:hypothetical protein BH11BAC3_BH11BAC3_17630 [soil metagenome]